MTSVRGQVRNGVLVFLAAVTEQLGLREGDTVDVPREALHVTPTVSMESKENPFLALIGIMPPLPDGMTAVQFTRELRGSDADGNAEDQTTDESA